MKFNCYYLWLVEKIRFSLWSLVYRLFVSSRNDPPENLLRFSQAQSQLHFQNFRVRPIIACIPSRGALRDEKNNGRTEDVSFFLKQS